MNDTIKIPYIGKEYSIDSFFGNDTAEDTKNLLAKYPQRFDAQRVLETACNNFRGEWIRLERVFGHLYGLWDDCIEPQIRAWFGFPSSQRINEERRHIYFDCRHNSLEA